MASSAELVCVDPARIKDIWPHVSPLLSRAVEQCGDWSLNDIRTALDQGALLWITIEGKTIGAAAITRLIETKHGLACHAVACGGSDLQWEDRLGQIEEYAKAEGCNLMRVEGREGWKRVFKSYGVAWITLEKRIK